MINHEAILHEFAQDFRIISSSRGPPCTSSTTTPTDGRHVSHLAWPWMVAETSRARGSKLKIKPMSSFKQHLVSDLEESQTSEESRQFINRTSVRICLISSLPTTCIAKRRPHCRCRRPAPRSTADAAAATGAAGYRPSRPTVFKCSK